MTSKPFPMFALLTIACTLLSASPVLAQSARPKRPTVCAQWSTLAAPGGKLLVCLDGKRPSVWSGPWATVEFQGHTYALGYR